MILHVAAGSAPRSVHVDIAINGRMTRALVDTSASHMFIGPATTKYPVDKGCPIKDIPPQKIVCAAKQVEFVTQVAPFQGVLEGRETDWSGYVVRTSTEEIALGLEFLRTAHIVIDAYGSCWWYRETSQEANTPTSVESAYSFIMCCGLRPLGDQHNGQLQKLLNEKILPIPDGSFPVTSLDSHRISVGDAVPMRQTP